MFKIDNLYKIVASTFGIAYIVGIIIALIFARKGILFLEPTKNITQSIMLTSSINFKLTLTTAINEAVNLFVIPFAYLVSGVQYAHMHVALLTSSFIGQVKLLVEIIPQFLFFITFIIFSTLGLKVIFLIVKLFVNKFVIKETKYKINIELFKKQDIKMLYIGLISAVIATTIHTHLLKILFMFFLNLKAISYVLLGIIYFMIIFLSIYVTYVIINNYLKKGLIF